MSAVFIPSFEALPEVKVDIVESGIEPRPGALACTIDDDIKFDTSKIESFFFARWETVLYDALLVAAAIEFCDIVKKRPAYKWGREFHLCIPVHDLERWTDNKVLTALHDALDFLTGDRWHINFVSRKRKVSLPPMQQTSLMLNVGISAVIPYSNGLDSRAVSGLFARELGNSLARVRLGPKTDSYKNAKHSELFTTVPYQVSPHKSPRRESSSRSRGFKFAIVSGLAAYLSGASKVIMPESGQGALGVCLVTIGQTYPDYRNHPLFGRRMEKLFDTLLSYQLTYEYPRIWHTKGETLAQFINECDEDDAAWKKTRSCWQRNTKISVNGHARQCGICAACMLRRLAIHTARQTEDKSTYVWECINASTFEAGAAPDFDRRKITQAMKEYAIAGTLHLDHMAELIDSSSNVQAIKLAEDQLARSLGLPRETVQKKLNRLLRQHKTEWEAFVGSLDPRSFVAKWAFQGRP